MATQKQIEANRANAQKSSGPRTPEGKAASRFNALKHGVHAESQIIPGEDPAELDALTHSYYDELQPQGPVQQHYVDRLILCDWLRRRYHRIQAELIDQLAWEVEERSKDDESGFLAGQAYLRSGRVYNDALVKLFRQINANDRTYDRALATLQSLQAASASNRTPISTERTQIHLLDGGAGDRLSSPAAFGPVEKETGDTAGGPGDRLSPPAAFGPLDRPRTETGG
jgi:hypothetical protein